MTLGGMMSSTNKFRFEVAKLELRPNDLLAVRFPASEPMADEQIQKVMQSLKNILPASVGVAWFKGDVSIGVIRPTDAAYGDGPAPANQTESEMHY